MATPQEQAKDAKYGPVVAIVDSASEPDKRYEVRRTHEGTLSCQCMGWRFNKDTPRHCRHTDATEGKSTVKIKSQTVSTPKPLAVQKPVAAAVAQSPKAVSVESEACARDIVNGRLTVSQAKQRVEAAIRKFMVEIAAPAPFVEVDRGVRMITLDD